MIQLQLLAFKDERLNSQRKSTWQHSPKESNYEHLRNILTFSQPAVEHILPELRKQRRGSHFRGREIQQEFSQTWDDRFLNAKSNSSSTEAEPQHVFVGYPGLTAYPLARWRRFVRKLFQQDPHVSRGYKCHNYHSC